MMEQKKSNSIADIYKILPGTDCGSESPCGSPKCAFFAKAVLEGKVNISQCPYNSDEVQQQIILIIDEFYR